MNKTNAKKIAQTITMEQLSSMFENAKENFKDWESVSDINKGMSKGAAWNILKGGFDSMVRISDMDRNTAVKNMVWEFGDFLDDSLKVKTTRKKIEPKQIYHQQPNF